MSKFREITAEEFFKMIKDLKSIAQDVQENLEQKIADQFDADVLIDQPGIFVGSDEKGTYMDITFRTRM